MSEHSRLRPIENITYHPAGRPMFEHGVSREELRGYPTDGEGNEIRYSWTVYMSPEENEAFTNYVESGGESGLAGFHRMKPGHFLKEYSKIQDWRLRAAGEFEQASDDTEVFSAERRLQYWTELSERIEEDPRLWAHIQNQ
jgi:hypothetical protein